MANEPLEACAGCLLEPLELSLVLVCSHRLCLSCARQQLQGALATCPSCGRETAVDAAAAQQIRAFQGRQEVRRVRPNASDRGQESVRSSSKGSPCLLASPREAPRPLTPVCGQCEEGADVSCVQCEELFCSRCFKQIHGAGRMREHRSRPVFGHAKPESDQLYCPQHGEALRFFCRDCQICVCADCAVQRGRSHHGHDVVSAKVAFQEMLRPMQELVEAFGQPARKQELLEALERGRKEAETSQLALSDVLKSQEECALKALGDLGCSADATLLEKSRRCEEDSLHMGRLREWLEVLRSELPKDEMNDILKVNMYMKVKSGLAAMLPQKGDLQGNYVKELERMAQMQSNDLDSLVTARLREIQEVCRLRTMEINSWTEDLTRDLRAVSEDVPSSLCCLFNLFNLQVYGQHAPIRAKMVRSRISMASFYHCRRENCSRSSNGFPVCPPLWCGGLLKATRTSCEVGLETVLDMDDNIEFEDIMNLEAT